MHHLRRYIGRHSAALSSRPACCRRALSFIDIDGTDEAGAVACFGVGVCGHGCAWGGWAGGLVGE